MYGQRGSDGGVPYKSHSAILGCGEVPNEAAYLLNSGVGWLPLSPMSPREVLSQHGRLVMMRSTPAGKACVNSAGVKVLESMCRRVSYPSIASRGRKRGCRLYSRVSLCAVAVCASGSMSAHVYEASAWHAFRTASNHVAMPPQSSTIGMGLWGRMYLIRMDTRGEEGGMSLGEGLRGLGVPVGGVCREIDVGQIGKGLVGCSEGGWLVVFPSPVCSGRI